MVDTHAFDSSSPEPQRNTSQFPPNWDQRGKTGACGAPKSETPMSTAWVISRKLVGHSTQFWAGSQWTYSAPDAVRFVRECDAARTAKTVGQMAVPTSVAFGTLHAEPSPKATPEPIDESCWLIEGIGPAWYGKACNGLGGWVPAASAIRFARKEDAEAMRDVLARGGMFASTNTSLYKVTEHGFYSPAKKPEAPKPEPKSLHGGVAAVIAKIEEQRKDWRRITVTEYDRKWRIGGHGGFDASWVIDELRAAMAKPMYDGPLSPLHPSMQLDKARSELHTLRQEREELRGAMGLLTALHPSMEVDVNYPMCMAQQIVAKVRAERATADLNSRAVFDIGRALEGDEFGGCSTVESTVKAALDVLPKIKQLRETIDAARIDVANARSERNAAIGKMTASAAQASQCIEHLRKERDDARKERDKLRSDADCKSWDRIRPYLDASTAGLPWPEIIIRLAERNKNQASAGNERRKRIEEWRNYAKSAPIDGRKWESPIEPSPSLIGTDGHRYIVTAGEIEEAVRIMQEGS